MLDHGRCRLLELEDDTRGRVEIEQIGVRELLALEHADRAETTFTGLAVPPGHLMRVFAVAQDTHAIEVRAEHDGQADLGRRRASERVAVHAHGLERRGNHRVVRGRVRECLARELEAERRRGSAGLGKRRENARVVRGVDDHQHVAEVLCRGAHQAGSADVDFLDEAVEGRLRVRGGRRERVQVHHHEIDEANPVALDGGQIVGAGAAREDAPVNGRMEGLDPPVEHLGEAGDVRDAPDRQARVGEGTGGPSGRDELGAKPLEALAKGRQTALVRDAEDGAAEFTLC